VEFTRGLGGIDWGGFVCSQTSPKLCHDLTLFQTSKPKILASQVSKLFKLALSQVTSDFQGGLINFCSKK
jgi:hypothetical protein